MLKNALLRAQFFLFVCSIINYTTVVSMELPKINEGEKIAFVTAGILAFGAVSYNVFESVCSYNDRLTEYNQMKEHFPYSQDENVSYLHHEFSRAFKRTSRDILKKIIPLAVGVAGAAQYRAWPNLSLENLIKPLAGCVALSCAYGFLKTREYVNYYRSNSIEKTNLAKLTFFSNKFNECFTNSLIALSLYSLIVRYRMKSNN